MAQIDDWAKWTNGEAVGDAVKDWTDVVKAKRPTWMEDAAYYRSPAEHWAAFTSNIQPFWQTLAPLREKSKSMFAEYALAAPYMAQAGVPTHFGQFIQDYPGLYGGPGQQPRPAPVPPATGGYGGYIPGPGYGPPSATGTYRANYEEMIRRANEAARAATQPPGSYLDPTVAGLDLNTPEGLAEWNKRAWYVSQFGLGAEDAYANQRAVANLVALQKPGGGRHQGAMATAIRDAMARLQQQRANVGAPRESFLSYILGGGGRQPQEEARPGTEEPGNVPPILPGIPPPGLYGGPDQQLRPAPVPPPTGGYGGFIPGPGYEPPVIPPTPPVPPATGGYGGYIPGIGNEAIPPVPPPSGGYEGFIPGIGYGADVGMTEKDKERNRRIRQYMAQGMPYDMALRIANEGL